MTKLVAIKEFLNRHEAGIAQGLLEREGIRSIISADDCGGYRPHLTFGMGAVRILVEETDVQDALEVLKVMDTDPDQENGQE